MQDVYCESELLGTLSNALMGRLEPRVVLPEEVDSTNSEARRRFINGEEGCVLILANRQTAGRGRLGRQFHSPSSGIYFSLLYPIDSARLSSSVSVTCAASVAVMRALRRTVGKETRIKWVNDLYHNGKKVCGILTEAVTLGQRSALIVGIGINLRPTAFPPELAGIAGDLGDLTTPRGAVVKALLEELLPYLRVPSDKSWLEDYRRASCVLGRRVEFYREGVAHGGLAVSVNEEGALTVLTEGGEVTLRTGEISLRTVE